MVSLLLVLNMTEKEIVGEIILGRYADKDSKAYKEFIMKNMGQYSRLLFSGMIIDFLSPCGLHLILANHHYLWRFMFTT